MWKIALGILTLVLASTPKVFAEHAFDSKAQALAHYIMAVSHDLNGQPKEAFEEYKQSITLNSGEPLPHLRLGAYYVRMGLLDAAINQLKLVLKADSHNAQAHYLLALVYSSQKKYDLAAQQYESILKIASKDNPNNLEIHIYLAQLYFSEGRYSQAIVQFKHILEVQPDNIAANYLIASSYLETGARNKAKDLFKKVLVLDPKHDGALNSLGYMYAEEGVSLDEALKMVRKAILLDGSNGAYYDTLGWILHKKGMNAEALMALQKAEVYIQDPVIYEHMGDVYKAVGEYALARKFWRRSLEMNPKQPHVQDKINSLQEVQARQEQP